MESDRGAVGRGTQANPAVRDVIPLVLHKNFVPRSGEEHPLKSKTGEKDGKPKY